MERVGRDLAQRPLIADGFRESLAALTRSADSSREAEEHLLRSVRDLLPALTALGHGQDRSTQALDLLRQEATTRHQQFRTLAMEQLDRLMVLGWSAMGLAILAVFVGLVVIWRR